MMTYFIPKKAFPVVEEAISLIRALLHTRGNPGTGRKEGRRKPGKEKHMEAKMTPTASPLRVNELNDMNEGWLYFVFCLFVLCKDNYLF